MKRLTRSILLVLAAAALASVLVFAGGENTVISLSYLNGTYADQLVSALKELTGGLQSAYDGALEKLEQKTGVETGGSWTSTAAFETVYPMAGETVTLSAGSGLVWYYGSGSASAVLVDVTAGTELPVGGALTAGHRYLAEQETVVAASVSSSCGAEGMWRTTATGSAPVPSPFRDVALGAWYYDAVMYAADKNLMGGVGDGVFAPGEPTSRGMIVTILYRLEGSPAVPGVSGFLDVADGVWYADAVAWAVSNNIVGGYGNGSFGPNDPITREDMAVILYRYAVYRGCDVTARADLSAYADISRISGYAVDAMQWANAEGLINGVTAAALEPKGSAVRAMAAAILMRFCENVVK